MSLARAVLRSPTHFTYSYPYQLWWPTPPVLLHLPITLAAWLSKILGLPLAFEALRVAGAAGSGAALAGIGTLLFPRKWRLMYFVVVLFAGGWFAWYALVFTFGYSGIYGLTEWWNYMQYALGPLYYWKLFLTQNLSYPTECVYHALVLGGIAALLAKRNVLAMVIAAATWFSNPFPAISLSAAALPFVVWTAIRSRERRHVAIALGWVAVCGIGLFYYAVFLQRWPLLRELESVHATAAAPPFSVPQAVCVYGPWCGGLAWSIFARGGRRHVWKNQRWRLIAMFAISQTVLGEYSRISARFAMQTHHFNRGYLLFAYQSLFLRYVFAISHARGKFVPGYAAQATRRIPALPGLIIFGLGLTFLDQPLMAIHDAFTAFPGYVPPEYRLVADFFERQPGILVFAEPTLLSPYLAAATSAIPFEAKETTFVPFADERKHALDVSLATGNPPVSKLGIRAAVMYRSSATSAALTLQGWTVTKELQTLLIMRPPTGE